MIERREITELEVVISWNAIGFAHRSKRFRLLDRIDAEVGFQIEVELEHVGRIPGHAGYDLEHLVGDLARWR